MYVGEVTPTVACLIVGTPALWWCSMSDAGTAFLRLPVHLQVHLSWAVMEKAQEQILL